MDILKIQNISQVFQEGAQAVKALEGIHLTVEEGDFVCLSGPSGSGKTTLLNLIGCLAKPVQGKIFFDSSDVTQLSEEQLTELRLRKIGFIFQDYNLIPTFTVLENIEYVLWLQKISKEERKKRSLSICERFKIEAFVDRFPYQLSRGQQQRVAVTRAIVHKPRIVLGDELTANLDHQTGISLMEFLKQLNEAEKITFLYATHDPVMMKFADRIVRLEDGRITNEQFDPATLEKS